MNSLSSSLIVVRFISVDICYMSPIQICCSVRVCCLCHPFVEYKYHSKSDMSINMHCLLRIISNYNSLNNPTATPHPPFAGSRRQMHALASTELTHRKWYRKYCMCSEQIHTIVLFVFISFNSQRDNTLNSMQDVWQQKIIHTNFINAITMKLKE